MIIIPNWCSNLLSVVGSDEQVAQFVEIIQSEGEDDLLQRFVPLPNENLEDWYGWRIQNWGTKWDIPISDLYPPDDPEEYFCHVPGITSVVYRFDTAWSPPIAAIETISQQYPDCLFMLVYDEPGMDFYGESIFQNGMLTHEINSASVVNGYRMLREGPDPEWLWNTYHWEADELEDK